MSKPWKSRVDVHESERQRWRKKDDDLSRTAQILQVMIQEIQRGGSYRKINGRWREPWQDERRGPWE